MPSGNPGVPRTPFSRWEPLLSSKGIVLKSEYRGVAVKSKFRCSQGHEYESTIESQVANPDGWGCKRCHDTFKAFDNLMSHEEYSEMCIEKYGWGPIESYKGNNYKLRYECMNCERWVVTYPATIRHGMTCPCRGKSRYKIYSLQGRNVKVLGYEPQALDWILANTDIKPSQITVDSEGTPDIKYKGLDGLTHVYRPDFLIKGNILVEVKSLSTIGINPNQWNLKGRHLWNTLRLKARACIDQGYTFKLLVMDESGNRLYIPDNYLDLRFNKLRKLFNHGDILY